MFHIQQQENSEYNNQNIDHVDYLYNLKITYQMSQIKLCKRGLHTQKSCFLQMYTERCHILSAFGESMEKSLGCWYIVHQFSCQLSFSTQTSQEHHIANLSLSRPSGFLMDSTCVQVEAYMQTRNVSILGRNNNSLPPV